jgi:hypothetical protein
MGARSGEPIALQVHNRDYAIWEERTSPWTTPAGDPPPALPHDRHSVLSRA